MIVEIFIFPFWPSNNAHGSLDSHYHPSFVAIQHPDVKIQIMRGLVLKQNKSLPGQFLSLRIEFKPSACHLGPLGGKALLSMFNQARYRDS